MYVYLNSLNHVRLPIFNHKSSPDRTCAIYEGVETLQSQRHHEGYMRIKGSILSSFTVYIYAMYALYI